MMFVLFLGVGAAAKHAGRERPHSAYVDDDDDDDDDDGAHSPHSKWYGPLFLISDA